MRPFVTITLQNNTAAVLSYVSSTDNVNVSRPQQLLKDGNVSNVKGFQLSSDILKLSKLDSTRTFFGDDGYSGYLSASTESAEITLQVTGDTIGGLYIVFDTLTGEYAKSISIGDHTFTNNSVATYISFFAKDTVKLRFSQWSASNSTIKVTNIAIVPTLRFYGSDLIDFKCSENLLDSDLQITPGICEQYADINVYDRYSVLHTLAREGLLGGDADVSINADSYALGVYVASDWDIEIDNTVVGITCRDKSYLFEKIPIARVDIANRTIDDLLNVLFSQADIPWNYLDVATRTRCLNISVPNNWFAASDLKALLDKICSLGMLRMYWSLNTFYVGRAV